MNPEIKQNLSEKLRIVSQELLEMLDQNIKVMLAEHSRDGNVGSGATIKKTMDFIAAGNARLYQEVIEHLTTLSPRYHSQIEGEVQNLAESAQESYKQGALKRLQKSTEIAGNPKLYKRMIPDVESSMATDMANFQNSLNAFVIDLKLKNNMSPVEKGLWSLEFLLLLVSMFIAGMWFKDPDGNYEPVLVGLGLVISLIAVGIKFGVKKVT